MSFKAYDPASFDLILPARATACDIEVAYAAVTVSPDVAALLCDRIRGGHRSPAFGSWAEYDDGTIATIARLLDTLPRFYQPRPGYRDMEIERALEQLPAQGFGLSRWEERDGRLLSSGGAMTATPFGVSWWASAHEPLAGNAHQAVGETDLPRVRALPPVIGRLETGMVGLPVLRRIADGELALRGREPV